MSVLPVSLAVTGRPSSAEAAAVPSRSTAGRAGPDGREESFADVLGAARATARGDVTGGRRNRVASPVRPARSSQKARPTKPELGDADARPTASARPWTDDESGAGATPETVTQPSSDAGRVPGTSPSVTASAASASSPTSDADGGVSPTAEFGVPAKPANAAPVPATPAAAHQDAAPAIAVVQVPEAAPRAQIADPTAVRADGSAPVAGRGPVSEGLAAQPVTPSAIEMSDAGRVPSRGAVVAARADRPVGLQPVADAHPAAAVPAAPHRSAPAMDSGLIIDDPAAAGASASTGDLAPAHAPATDRRGAASTSPTSATAANGARQADGPSVGATSPGDRRPAGGGGSGQAANGSDGGRGRETDGDTAVSATGRPAAKRVADRSGADAPGAPAARVNEAGIGVERGSTRGTDRAADATTVAANRPVADAADRVLGQVVDRLRSFSVDGAPGLETRFDDPQLGSLRLIVSGRTGETIQAELVVVDTKSAEAIGRAIERAAATSAGLHGIALQVRTGDTAGSASNGHTSPRRDGDPRDETARSFDGRGGAHAGDPGHGGRDSDPALNGPGLAPVAAPRRRSTSSVRPVPGGGPGRPSGRPGVDVRA